MIKQMQRYFRPDLEECLEPDMLKDLMNKFAKRIAYAERLTSAQIRGAFVFEFMQLVTWGTVKRLTPPLKDIIKLYNKYGNGAYLYEDRNKTILPKYKHYKPKNEQKNKSN